MKGQHQMWKKSTWGNCISCRSYWTHSPDPEDSVPVLLCPYQSEDATGLHHVPENCTEVQPRRTSDLWLALSPDRVPRRFGSPVNPRPHSHGSRSWRLWPIPMAIIQVPWVIEYDMWYPFVMSPFGRACPLEVEHKLPWTLKKGKFHHLQNFLIALKWLTTWNMICQDHGDKIPRVWFKAYPS